MGVDGWYNEPGMKGMVGAHVCCSSCMFGIWKDGVDIASVVDVVGCLLSFIMHCSLLLIG